MEKRPAVDLQAISVDVQQATDSRNKDFGVSDLATLYMRALDEIGFRKKPGRKATRVRNAPRRKSIRGVRYGT